LLFSLELGATNLSRGLAPPGHFAGRFRLPLDSAGSRRCAPCPAHIG
jgi:hypothetical protein